MKLSVGEIIPPHFIRWASSEPGPYLMYCSDLLYFFAKYLAEALLGILTKDSSLL